jgi:hypothetical protein
MISHSSLARTVRNPDLRRQADGRGDVTLPRGGKHMAWSILHGGNYMQTPIVVGDLLYACRDNGC